MAFTNAGYRTRLHNAFVHSQPNHKGMSEVSYMNVGLVIVSHSHLS